MGKQLQVDAWGAFIPGRGDLVEQLKSGVREEVGKRGIAGLEIKDEQFAMSKGMDDFLYGAGKPQDYIIFEHHLDKFARTTVALRIAPRGSVDLELGWRLFESNANKKLVAGLGQVSLISLAVLCFVFGAITLVFGLGLIPIAVGIFLLGTALGWWNNSRGNTFLTPEQKLDARVLVQTVDFCLMKQLEKLGVSSDEIRILVASREEGMGKL